MSKTLCCPKCKNTNIEVLGNNRKSFSVGKAVGGALLTGGIGALVGFTGKKESMIYSAKNVEIGGKQNSKRRKFNE